MSVVFFDTWGWVALAHAGDAHHADVARWYAGFLRADGGVATSEVVLVETLQVLTARCAASGVLGFADRIRQSLASGDLQLLLVTADVLAVSLLLFDRLNGPAQRRSRQPARMVSLADCTSMALMRSGGLQEVLTGDDHFVHAGLGLSRVELTG